MHFCTCNIDANGCMHRREMLFFRVFLKCITLRKTTEKRNKGGDPSVQWRSQNWEGDRRILLTPGREKRGSVNRYKIMSIFYRLLTEGITCPEHIFDFAILQKQTHSSRHTTWWQLTRDKTRFNSVLVTGWHSESYWSPQCIPWCLVI